MKYKEAVFISLAVIVVSLLIFYGNIFTGSAVSVDNGIPKYRFSYVIIITFIIAAILYFSNRKKMFNKK